PAVLLAAECQPPAQQPAGAEKRRVRAACRHPGGVEGRPVGRVEQHDLSLTSRRPTGETGRDRVRHDGFVTHVAIVGGGPGGYEAALVAAQLGAEVTIVDRDGIGGSTVLTDCVPSKTLIATSDVLTEVERSAELGVDSSAAVRADLKRVNERVRRLALAQSEDITRQL